MIRDGLDMFCAEQLRRVQGTLKRVDVRMDARAKAARAVSLSDAYGDADTLVRLAQIAENAGRVVCPGLDTYDDRDHSPAQAKSRAVDHASALRRKYAVNWSSYAPAVHVRPAEREP